MMVAAGALAADAAGVAGLAGVAGVAVCAKAPAVKKPAISAVAVKVLKFMGRLSGGG